MIAHLLLCVIFDGCSGTFVRRVSPVWTGVGDSGVQTRFSSCRHPPGSPLIPPPPPSHPILSPPHPPPTDVAATAAFLLFMGPACFDFKYLPRRRLFRSARGGGGREKSRVDLKRTRFQIFPIRMRARARSGRGRRSLGPVFISAG